MKPAILIAALALGACMTTKPSDSPPALADSCDTSILAGMVGKPFSAAVEAEAKKQSGLTNVRVIRPGMAVTMDFQPGRLNIDLDEKGVVTGFRCG
ncbi:I78 family peptidase inhibitor [uncultured Sphingomonas sp.]|uniref:I78 family peptidase inhibitor n=1 Tax=uncultured Sphingomonas sp. TaxID=158754 RepID=UPI0025D9C85E|nr:I78 family peptidase inhibitor [uncultured Sphingomonas sp.]